MRAELLYGVANSRRKESNREIVDAFLAPYELLPFGGDAVEHFADIRAHLERIGEVIGPYDLLIAATARSIGSILVTNKTREFSRVAGLRTEDWSRSGGGGSVVLNFSRRRPSDCGEPKRFSGLPARRIGVNLTFIIHS